MRTIKCRAWKRWVLGVQEIARGAKGGRQLKRRKWLKSCRLHGQSEISRRILLLAFALTGGVNDICEENFVYCASHGKLRFQSSHWQHFCWELFDNKLIISSSAWNNRSHKGPLWIIWASCSYSYPFSTASIRTTDSRKVYNLIVPRGDSAMYCLLIFRWSLLLGRLFYQLSGLHKRTLLFLVYRAQYICSFFQEKTVKVVHGRYYLLLENK